MPSLRDVQLRFASALDAADRVDARLQIYRATVRANYRNALRATYRVVRALVGGPFFDTAVDAYALAHPSRSGDLNIYGDRFGEFLADYPHASDLAYLPDVARLEWCVDCAWRAADAPGTPEDVLAALGRLPADALAAQGFELDPSIHLLTSAYPVLRIWQVHHTEHGADEVVDFSAGTDYLMIRRESDEVVVERVTAAEFAWLRVLAQGLDLAMALDSTVALDPEFDLGAALRARIADRTLIGVRTRDSIG
jgi:uncharacterized protein